MDAIDGVAVSAADFPGSRHDGPRIRRCRRPLAGQHAFVNGTTLSDHRQCVAARRHRRRHIVEDPVRPHQHRSRRCGGEAEIRQDPSFPIWFRHEVLSANVPLARGRRVRSRLFRISLAVPVAAQGQDYFIPGQQRPGPAQPARPAQPSRPRHRPRAARAGRATVQLPPQHDADQGAEAEPQLPPDRSFRRRPMCRRCRKARLRRPPSSA